MKIIVVLDSIVPLIDAIKHQQEPDAPFEVFESDKRFKAVIEHLITCVLRRYRPDSIEIKDLMDDEFIVDMIEQHVARQISRLIIREKLRRITLHDLEGCVVLHV